MESINPTEHMGELSAGGAKIVTICVMILSLATTAIAFRPWSRKIKGFTLCFNDYAILAAFVSDISPCREA